MASTSPRHPLTPRSPPISLPRRTPRQHIFEWNPLQPDHQFPCLDLPSNSQHLQGASCDSTLREITFSSDIQKMLQTNFRKIHQHQDEIFRRLLRTENSVQLVLDRIAEHPSLVHHQIDTKRPSGPKQSLYEPEEEKETINLQKMHLGSEANSGIVPKKPVDRSTVLPGTLGTKSSADAFGRKSSANAFGRASSANVFGRASSANAFGRKSSANAGELEWLAQIVMNHSSNNSHRSAEAKLIWQFFENRNSGCGAFLYGMYFAPLIIVMSVCFPFFQTAEDLAMPAKTFSALQVGFEFLFAGEFILRLCVCPDRRDFWCNLFNWIDFCSASPICLRLYLLITASGADESSASSAILALVPMLRLLKILRRFHKFHLLKEAVWLSIEALPVLTYAMVLIAMMFAGLIYFVEPRSLIPSLPNALWLVIVTMTTVGYGDTVPSTSLGRIISALLMVLSGLYMAMPIGIVGNAFSQVWSDRDRLLLIAAIRENFEISGVSPSLCHDLFQVFAEGSSLDAEDAPTELQLTLDQFRKMMVAFKVNVSDDRIVALFKTIDIDGGGSISTEEFIQLFGSTITSSGSLDSS